MLGKILGYVAAVGALLAFIWALVTRNEKLQNELAAKKAKEKLLKAYTDKERAEEAARKLEKEFNDAYDRYRATRPNGSGRSDS